MANMIIRPASGTGNKVILQDQAGAAVMTTADSGADLAASCSISPLSLPSGCVVQIQQTTVQTVMTGTATIPDDNTIPQKTEGNEWFTVTITPKHVNNKLLVEASAIMGANHGLDVAILALFKNTEGDALAVGAESNIASWYGNAHVSSPLMTAGTTSAITFKARGGSKQSGTVTLNGDETNQYFGGKASSWIRVTEYAA